MGIIKAQYDPATGKAIYDAVSGKQQIAEPNSQPSAGKCANCTDVQPVFIDVTFSGITDCTNCSAYGGFYRNNISVASAFNGNTFRVTAPAGGVAWCVYVNTAGGSYGSADVWSNSDCTGVVGTPTYDTLDMALQFTSATTYTLIVNITVAGFPTVRVFTSSGTIASGDCFDLDGDIISNTNNCSTTSPPVFCDNGTATITL